MEIMVSLPRQEINPYQHVLASIPIHLLSAAVLPNSIFTLIEKVCADFLWGSIAERSKFHWIRWKKGKQDSGDLGMFTEPSRVSYGGGCGPGLRFGQSI